MLKIKLFSAVLAFSALAISLGVEAHPRGGYYHHPRFSFYLGVPWYSSPFYSYYPYYYPYYPPEIVTAPASPPVYIERGGPQSTELPAGYWYYCSDPEGYYPYIKECPSGWLQVDPVPPSPR